MTTLKGKGKQIPALMDRAARRALLFAPINVQSFGGQSWGGSGIVEDSPNNSRQQSSGEYVQDFRRRSHLTGEDE